MQVNKLIGLKFWFREELNTEWFIIDGDINKESANGTWISLTDYRLKKERQESDPKEIENESEIKISDSILKVNKKNF